MKTREENELQTEADRGDTRGLGDKIGRGGGGHHGGGGHGGHHRGAHGVRRILHQAQRSRFPLPYLNVVYLDDDDVDDWEDAGVVSFEAFDDEDEDKDVVEGVLQTVSPGSREFAPSVSSVLPVFSGLYRKFVSAFPVSKIVRADDGKSYKDLLEKRVETLEKAFGAHVSDGHGGDLGDVIGSEPKRVIGERVPLSLPPGLRNRVACWQDGSEIVCSLISNGKDGEKFVLTTGAPAWRSVDEVVGYAAEAGVDPVDVVGVLPVVAQIMAGGSLVEELLAVEPNFQARREVVGGCFPIVGRTEIGFVTPVLAALVALLQRAQKGDKQALTEAEKVSQTENGKKLITKANEVLGEEQRRKRAKKHFKKVL